MLTPDLYLLVGPPGSGKTTLAEGYLCNNGYYRVSQDESGRLHYKKFLKALDEGKKIVVDRMNFTKAQREKYLLPAKEKGLKTRIVILETDRFECEKRVVMRKGHPTIKNSRDAGFAFSTFYRNYEPPTEDEADSIVRLK